FRGVRYRSYLFFFSSRRRHTRFSRDWSSDVCSSDLRKRLTRILADKRRASACKSCEHYDYCAGGPSHVPVHDGSGDCAGGKRMRSEERRVGKEGRSRGSVERERNKMGEIDASRVDGS